eukprot:CAMPEP_0115872656 /NCGR_PEP_ID=MMETSP0287-20121206/23547_1 /TAXON_ID=412157 /ORGANISM="Chrysochromulina rotalis, Strain UIO044" /LENGTH=42 /DNA_ID= /DNA_START= /DNA_END= /DNA_ORIENTATION=
MLREVVRANVQQHHMRQLALMLELPEPAGEFSSLRLSLVAHD